MATPRKLGGRGTSRAAVMERSMGMCEAFYRPEYSRTFARCWHMPVEVHHLLTRARGGTLLDRVGEDYHLIALCNNCHRRCDGLDAYMNGLLIEGFVLWNKANSWPVYTGPDGYLSARYSEIQGTSKSRSTEFTYHPAPR